MPKAKKKADPKQAKVLKRRLRNMVQLQHFEEDDRFIVLVQVSPDKHFFMDFDTFKEVFDDFEAIVHAKKLRK